jgi:hypothetical protein
MRMRDLLPGAIVYHKKYFSWGRGEVIRRVVGFDALVDRRIGHRAQVKWANGQVSINHPSSLRKSPDRKGIKAAIHAYHNLKIKAYERGGRLFVSR